MVIGVSMDILIAFIVFLGTVFLPIIGRDGATIIREWWRLVDRSVEDAVAQAVVLLGVIDDKAGGVHD